MASEPVLARLGETLRRALPWHRLPPALGLPFLVEFRKQLRKKDIRSDAETDQVEDAIEALAIDIDGFLDQELTGRDRS